MLVLDETGFLKKGTRSAGELPGELPGDLSADDATDRLVAEASSSGLREAA